MFTIWVQFMKLFHCPLYFRELLKVNFTLMMDTLSTMRRRGSLSTDAWLMPTASSLPGVLGFPSSLPVQFPFFLCLNMASRFKCQLWVLLPLPQQPGPRRPVFYGFLDREDCVSGGPQAKCCHPKNGWSVINLILPPSFLSFLWLFYPMYLG